MRDCPHCHAPTVRLWAKLWSSPVLPLACRACGGLSHAPGSQGSTVLVVNTLLFTAAGFLGFHWRSWAPVIVATVLALSLWLYRLHIQPLLALTPQQVARVRAARGVEVLVLMVLLRLQ